MVHRVIRVEDKIDGGFLSAIQPFCRENDGGTCSTSDSPLDLRPFGKIFITNNCVAVNNCDHNFRGVNPNAAAGYDRRLDSGKHHASGIHPSEP
jgi:hypothetical protein